MRSILALLIAFASLACHSTSSRDAALRDIDAFAANVVRTIPEVPSIGLAVVQDGRRHTRAFGYADVEHKIAATTRTGYYIGSTTKAFTALSVLLLAEQGKLDLDAPVATYLPEITFPAPIDGRAITLRKLMSHSAPIRNSPIVFRTAFTGEHSPELLVQLLATTTPRDEGFRYDNLGYVIAALAMERVTGHTWQQLHDELVFTPLGMHDTTALMSEATRKPLALPYELVNSGRFEVLAYRKNDRMMHAAGGTVTTAEDVARWIEAQLGGGRISRRAIAETHRQQAAIGEPGGPFGGTAYGFGWFRGAHGGDAVVHHGGGFEGWRTLFSFMPEKQLGVAVMTNSGHGNPVTQLVTSYAFDRLLNKPDVEGTYAAKLAKLRADTDVMREGVAAETAKRALRTSQLKHASAAYAARYEHPQLGTLAIEEREGKLVASIGQMHAELEPFTEPESARVQLLPTSGEVLRFVFASGETADAVKYRDELFTRR